MSNGKKIIQDAITKIRSGECPLLNSELIEICNNWVSKLCESKGNDWCLSIPPNFERDPDLLFSEMAKRFEASQYEIGRIMSHMGKLKQRLEEAEKVIGFYGDDDTYKSKCGGHLGNIRFKGKINSDLGKLAQEYMTNKETNK